MQLNKVRLKELPGMEELDVREALAAYEGWMEEDAKVSGCVVVRVKRISTLTQASTNYTVTYDHQTAIVKQKMSICLALELLAAGLVGQQPLDNLLYFYVGSAMITYATVIDWT